MGDKVEIDSFGKYNAITKIIDFKSYIFENTTHKKVIIVT